MLDLLRRVWNSFVPYAVREKLQIGTKMSLQSSDERKIMTEVLDAYRDTSDTEIRECLQVIKNNARVSIFNYFWTKEYSSDSVCLTWDDIHCLWYYILGGKKMYLKRGFSEQEAREYVNSILLEQDIRSPHRYTTNDFYVEDGEILFDLGAAEGFFALQSIENVKKVVLFECDLEWVEALNITFEQYRDKVIIVNKFVSNCVNENEISLDYISKMYDIEPTFVKMDIEGAELLAIEGMNGIIQNAGNLKICVCCYHNVEDEKNIKTLLDTFDIETSSGYMCYKMWDTSDWSFPYFRRGVIRARMKRE